MAIPVITSELTASATVGVGFQYTIEATNTPIAWGASPLPDGVEITGDMINGVFDTMGTYSPSISASNGSGAGSATLVITVVDPIVVTVATKAYASPEQSTFSEDTFDNVIVPLNTTGFVAPLAPTNLIVFTPHQVGSGTATATWTPPANAS